MQEEHFYRVITFTELPKETDVALPEYDTRAHYLEKIDAIRCVQENWGDIYEVGSYPAAMVIETPFGLYPYCPHRWYFEWKGGWELAVMSKRKNLNHWSSGIYE